VHRIGRTGRAGASGIAISFCDRGEREHLRAIEKLTGATLAAVSGLPEGVEELAAVHAQRIAADRELRPDFADHNGRGERRGSFDGGRGARGVRGERVRTRTEAPRAERVVATARPSASPKPQRAEHPVARFTAADLGIATKPAGIASRGRGRPRSGPRH
jgi:ATP-dependent RNA helicase RhlE